MIPFLSFNDFLDNNYSNEHPLTYSITNFNSAKLLVVVNTSSGMCSYIYLTRYLQSSLIMHLNSLITFSTYFRKVVLFGLTSITLTAYTTSSIAFVLYTLPSPPLPTIFCRIILSYNFFSWLRLFNHSKSNNSLMMIDALFLFCCSFISMPNSPPISLLSYSFLGSFDNVKRSFSFWSWLPNILSFTWRSNSSSAWS